MIADLIYVAVCFIVLIFASSVTCREVTVQNPRKPANVHKRSGARARNFGRLLVLGGTYRDWEDIR
jgi:hypothetical protein